MTLYFSDFEWYMIDLIDMKNLWTPTVYLGGAKNVQKLGSFGEESLSYLWYQFSPHMMHYSEIVTATVFCELDFKHFPFDSHECPIEYGDAASSKEQMRFNITQGVFGNMSTKIGVEPIIIDNLPFPFEFKLVVMPTFELRNIYMISYSYTGIALKMQRKSLGQLLCGYFYPTTAFALLSMISFLIKPDIVSSFFTAIKLVLMTFIVN